MSPLLLVVAAATIEEGLGMTATEVQNETLPVTPVMLRRRRRRPKFNSGWEICPIERQTGPCPMFSDLTERSPSARYPSIVKLANLAGMPLSPYPTPCRPKMYHVFVEN